MVYDRRMKLIEYLNSLSPDQRAAFAKRCGTSLAHMRNVAYGKRCGESLAINIERESGRAVRCENLRPDVDWAYLRNTSIDGLPLDRREGCR